MSMRVIRGSVAPAQKVVGSMIARAIPYRLTVNHS